MRERKRTEPALKKKGNVQSKCKPKTANHHKQRKDHSPKASLDKNRAAEEFLAALQKQK